MSRVFVDTNVIAYARDVRESKKQPIAEKWLMTLFQRRTGRISWQVLAEYYAVATHRGKLAVTAELARADVRALAAWRPVLLDVALLDDAFRVQDSYGFSWWDSLIVTAALRSQSDLLLSEDFPEGLVVDGQLTIVNPFAAAALPAE
ncbi:MAG: PIN domain-containing protein [Rhodocyclaceae bacterium]|nr:MAG: PIN domain-containing protein [Rhodocyclaceae bacterium]